MKNSKKVLLGLLCSVVVLNTCIPMALAVNAPTGDEQNAEIIMRAEETEWRYKKINGAWYKRLWSITYAKWRTDWIPV